MLGLAKRCRARFLLASTSGSHFHVIGINLQKSMEIRKNTRSRNRIGAMSIPSDHDHVMTKENESQRH